MRDIKYHPPQKLITIDGTTLNINGWAIFLRLTKQRVSKLYQNGMLEERVRAKQKLSTEVYQKWIKAKKAQRLAIM
ncbi:MAG: hypothetical protein PHN44_05170 [Candidatus Marinimicrobia bacterium]|nr:hypothetical protein [Candidatus Neomarinimicrobiota bacterium]